ncbi:Serine/threonine-protein kinase AfsK [Nonomuraea coxensis DSM 45129]|uniref:Serine/threonine-protein kinase AfsK n=1 Tax=Nonomuraea coxensis DSM 45129 TaxID=1122611 RepID=A0ABX8TZZ9_9ACTN|nr:serine/threonine-protein kinase [Nonomuraea coxensis]QYC41072.1 Serine/threonine-protein kinase AfsK [Nonomuraea coxensis DSM 45129]
MPHVEPLRAGDPAAAGPYRLVGRLGAGGRGAGYLGRAPDGRPVAVKLLPEGPADRARLVRDLTVARRMEPSCLARVLDAAAGERPHVVREYVSGPTLEQAAPAPAAELPRLAVAVATGLDALHQAGVAHLALKPANVLLGPGGARVADYGIAGAYGTAGGTPAYLAPEQLAGGPCGAPADVFAWGAVIGFAATGVPPFGDGPPAEVAERVLRGEPRLDGLPAPLREVVTACLAKDPAARPAMREVLLRLIGAAPAPDDDYATPATAHDLRPPSLPLPAPRAQPPDPHVQPPAPRGRFRAPRASDTGTLLVRPFAAPVEPARVRAAAPPADWAAFQRAEGGQPPAFVDVLAAGDPPAARGSDRLVAGDPRRSHEPGEPRQDGDRRHLLGRPRSGPGRRDRLAHPRRALAPRARGLRLPVGEQPHHHRPERRRPPGDPPAPPRHEERRLLGPR